MNVSVIIPAYNAGKTIGETLESLRAQTFPYWEAIVVDDGSSDDTFAIATHSAEQDPRIRLISQASMGVCAARNIGINQAKKDWLLFLDADDWLLPLHLERLTNALAADYSLDAVYSRWARVAPDGACFNEEFSGQADKIFAWLARNNGFAIHACIVRRARVTSVGGFDTSYQTCEDWDLWQRVARTGARFGSILDNTARYRMRPGSASTDLLRLLNDGLRVVTSGHFPDPRVSNPSATYAEGLPKADLPGAKLDYVCWTAGLALGRGEDPLPLLSTVQQERYPGMSPELLAHYLFTAPLLVTCRSPADWNELWSSLEEKIQEFLVALEIQSMAPALAHRASKRLENLILEHSKAPRPLTIGSTHAVRQEVTEPIVDVTAPPPAERLHCAVEFEGKPLGSVTLPICDGFVSSYVLKDAIAARYAWTILEHFFHNTVYRELAVKRSETGLSLWRGSVCLADGLPEDGQLLGSVVHDRIGWIVFLQELWGLPQWQEFNFYSSRVRKKVILQELKIGVKNLLFGGGANSANGISFAPKQRAKKDRLVVEVSKKIPNVLLSTQELQVIPTVGGAALGIMPVEVKGNTVRAQQLRAAITKESGFELAVAAVREGLLGRPIAGPNLRARLANTNQSEK